MYKGGGRVRVYSEDGVFFGIYRYNGRTRVFDVEKFFYES